MIFQAIYYRFTLIGLVGATALEDRPLLIIIPAINWVSKRSTTALL